LLQHGTPESVELHLCLFMFYIKLFYIAYRAPCDKI
jgi:hypothetical protein